MFAQSTFKRPIGTFISLDAKLVAYSESISSGYKTLRFASVLSELSISVVPDNRGIVRGFPVVA